MSDELIIESKDGIGYLRFNRAEKHNAVSYAMWQGIARAADAFASDEDVRVVVVSGEGGRAFSSGADISQFEKQRTTADAIEVYNAAVDRALERLGTLMKPTIARIQGYCVGGGVGIALSCDLWQAFREEREPRFRGR